MIELELVQRKKGENELVDDQCLCSDTSLDRRGGKVPKLLKRRGKNEESRKKKMKREMRRK